MQVSSHPAEMAGLSKSFMERVAFLNGGPLVKSPVPWVMLTEQHRMPPTIRTVVAELFYNTQDRQLTDAESIGKREDPPYWPQIVQLFPSLAATRILCIPTAGKETRSVGTGMHSYCNMEEVDNLMEVVSKLVKLAGVDGKEVAICTMYEGQREAIDLRIRGDKDYDEIDVKNVDGYQGREKSIVLLSLVRSNKDNDFGFTTNPNRLNVSLSRSREMLIIFANFEMMRRNGKQIFKRLYRQLPIGMK